MAGDIRKGQGLRPLQVTKQRWNYSTVEVNRNKKIHEFLGSTGLLLTALTAPHAPTTPASIYTLHLPLLSNK